MKLNWKLKRTLKQTLLKGKLEKVTLTDSLHGWANSKILGYFGTALGLHGGLGG